MWELSMRTKVSNYFVFILTDWINLLLVGVMAVVWLIWLYRHLLRISWSLVELKSGIPTMVGQNVAVCDVEELIILAIDNNLVEI